MTKSDVVCAVGSGIAAPLLLALIELVVISILWALDVPVWRIPDWLGWICSIAGVFAAAVFVRDFYRILFHHCRKA